MGYIDEVLIKLRREYSKDEVVAALDKKLKDVEMENGKLVSEISHLEYEIKKTSTQKEIDKTARTEVRKEELYLNILNENKKLREENKILSKTNNSQNIHIRNIKRDLRKIKAQRQILKG